MIYRAILHFLPLLAIIWVSCVTKPVAQAPVAAPVASEAEDVQKTSTPILPYRFILIWEKGHPERASWTQALAAEVEKQLPAFDAASDRKDFCPNYDRLDHADRIQMWSTMIVWDAYYESGWNPKSTTVDVGRQNDRDTWSVGLLQMSVVDQRNYNLSLGYGFADLEDPVKNVKLALPIMGSLVRKYGVILGKPGAGSYWSTLRPATKGRAIQAMTRSLVFCR